MLNKTEFKKKLPFAVCRRTAKNVAVQGRTAKAPFAVRFAFAVRLVAFSFFFFLFYLF